PWTDVKTIRLVENASLHTGEHAVMGLKLSTMKQEVTKHLLCFETQGEEVQVPLKDFPQYQALLDALVEQTQEQKFGLEYERQETDDLQAAKAAGEDQYFGKKRMTVAGIVLVVLFITIKILSVFLKK
ncbi:MAG TPA: hypothetical protein PKA06_09570, partial [Gemmatales bacterium]|nr:hypothetical protein [Gemmatales bacterium]